MRITLFPDVQAATAQPYDICWPQLVTACQAPTEYASKQAMPLIKLGAFGEKRTVKGSLRSENNLLAVSGVEADYDAGTVNPETAAALLTLAGISAAIYTTPSHTPQAPRWRVLSPLSREYLPTARREFVGRINAALGGVLAGESFVAAQSFYFGRVAGVEYAAHVTDGQPVDLVDMPPLYPASAPVPGTHGAEFAERVADAATIQDLRSALASLSADDYHEWVAVGIALSSLGDAGYTLWQEWSATSTKHDPGTDLQRWGTFSPDRTGFASVFARAQAAGWINPAARQPIDLAAVGFGRPVPAPQAAPAVQSTSNTAASVPAPPPPVASVQVPRDINGNTFATAAQQPTIFAGCTYIQSLDLVLVPGGDLLNRSRFDVMFGAYTYALDRENGKTAKTAWEAFTRSQAINFPKAHDICFRPECPPGTVIHEAGRYLANIWWPVETARTPGDVTPFLAHLHRLFPIERDREILLAYLAAIVQYPGSKFQWCPVIQGGEGNGKSFFGYCIDHAIGDRYCHRPKACDITSKFNGWLRGKLFVCVEEIAITEKIETLDHLKDMISNARIEIQSKGIDQSTGDNRANFLMFTNRKNAIPIDVDKRRYAIFYTAQQTRADIDRDGMGGDYFPRLYAWARAGGYAHVAHYLAGYAIPAELNPAGGCHRAPDTSSTAEAIEVSLGPVEQEIRELIEQGDTPGLRGGWVSSIVLRRAMDAAHIRHLSPAKLTEALHALGYHHHPALPNGRITATIAMPDGGKPRLYIKRDHILNNEDRASEIARQYIAAQGVGLGPTTIQNNQHVAH